jgi:hypothetical protein
VWRAPEPAEAVPCWPPILVLGVLALAIFCCCVTMAMPLSSMVAFCNDKGIGPAHGAAMLSTQWRLASWPRQVRKHKGPERLAA